MESCKVDSVFCFNAYSDVSISIGREGLGKEMESCDVGFHFLF